MRGCRPLVKKRWDEDFAPINVDVNLVKSLLDSFSSQQGLPGPASNLLGLMGRQFPVDDAGQQEAKPKDKSIDKAVCTTLYKDIYLMLKLCLTSNFVNYALV